MLLTNRRSFFLRLLDASRSSKSPTRRNRPESKSRRQLLPYAASVEVLESRLLLSATAAYQPQIEVAGRVAAPVSANKAVRPAVTEATAPYAPAQMTTAYGVNQISFGGVTGTGAGQTIAIVDAFNDPDIVSDAAGFNTNFNLPQFNVAGGPTFTVLNQTGGTTLPTTDGQGWDLEESLDVEWAHSIAPEANIILYESNTNNDPDMDQAVATAAANSAVSVVSMSWGESEFAGETSEDPFVLTPTGRTGGVTFLAAAGDWDSPAIYPAYSPNVVSVGGTTLDIQPNGDYISETVWNNNNGYGTGGGISQYEPLPAYQDGLNGINGASTTNRNAPDISMDADPDTGVYVLDSYSGGWFQVGGTSLSTPMWAGLVAIANQGRAINGEPSLNGLTQTLPTLYSLPSTDFNDITTGGNGTYNAASGYDLVSGIGSPIANLLVPDLANSTINWSPTASGPASATTNENTPLTFSGNDAISVTDQIAGTNTDTLTLSVNDGSLALGSTDGLTFTAGGNDSPSLTVTGSIGDIESAVSGLVYTPNSGFTGSDSLSVQLADPLANVSASTSVPLTVNAPPSLSAPASGTLSEDGSLVFSTAGGNGISVTDTAAGSNADSLTLQVDHGVLTLTSTSGLSFTGANGTSSFTVSGTVANLDQALDGLIYQPTSGYIGPDSLTVSVVDPGDTLSASTSIPLTVNVQPPVITAPPTGSLPENGSFVFSSANGNAISFTDVNAGSKTDSLSLAVSHGTLTLGSTTGLTFSTGKNGTASFTVTGTVANLDHALATVTYKPTAAYWGSDSLSISVADSGNNQSASTSVALTINALSPPAITAPANASVGEDLSLTFSTANGNPITVADANAGTKTDSLTLSVTNGTLTLGSTTGLTFTSGKNSTAKFTVIGTLANLQTALSGLIYQPTTKYSGPDSLSVSISNSADGQSASTSVALTVTAANAPAITAPATAAVNENGSLVFSTGNGNAISFTDANAGTSKTESLTLSVANGTLKLSTTSGLTFASGKNSTGSFTVTGTVANLNAALSGLTYTPTSDYSGSDALAISVADPGDGLSASNGVSLTVKTLPPTLTAPSTASVAENKSLVFSKSSSNAISITDVNAGGSAIEQLALSATNGKLTLGSTTGITFSSGANKSSAMTISGTLTNLNNALKSLTFTPTTGYSGPASISLSYTDVGNSLTASATISVTVGSGAATSVGATTASSEVGSPATTPTSPTNDDSTDSETQWEGLSAAMELMNS